MFLQSLRPSESEVRSIGGQGTRLNQECSALRMGHGLAISSVAVVIRDTEVWNSCSPAAVPHEEFLRVVGLKSDSHGLLFQAISGC